MAVQSNSGRVINIAEAIRAMAATIRVAKNVTGRLSKMTNRETNARYKDKEYILGLRFSLELNIPRIERYVIVMIKGDPEEGSGKKKDDLSKDVRPA